MRGILRNQKKILIGTDAGVIDRIQRLLPTKYQRLLVRAANGGALSCRRPSPRPLEGKGAASREHGGIQAQLILQVVEQF